MLLKSKDYSLLNLQSVATKVSTTKGLPSLDYVDKLSGSIVYVADLDVHYAYTSTGWLKLVNTDVTYTYIKHFTGSQLADTCSIFWTDIKTECGIGSQYYISYPVFGRVYYDSSSAYIYTNPLHNPYTEIYQNGGTSAGKPSTYNIWFTPITSSGWKGTASIAINFKIHR